MGQHRFCLTRVVRDGRAAPERAQKMGTAQQPTFGDFLRRYRLAAGLSQEELAEQARLSARAISDLERGVRLVPRKETVELLVEALRLLPPERDSLEATVRRGRGSSMAPIDAAISRPSSLPLPAAPVIAFRDAGTRHPLIGRTHELALLEHHLSGERPPLLLLAGEPGIGKSRLLREAAIRGSGCGQLVLYGGCQRRGGQEPYAPLLEALERHLQGQTPAQRRDDLEGCAWMSRLLPELAEEGLTPLPMWSLPLEQERRLAFKAVARFLANIAGPAGTLLVLDDLQWAGGDALDLLAMLVRSGPESRLRVVGAYRDTEVGPKDPISVMLADLAHAGLAEHRTLTPLAPEEAEQLLSSLLDGQQDGDRALRERLAQRGGGVPFFLVSYTQGLRAGSIAGGAAESVPWNVAQGIRQRVAVLPKATQEVLSAAAIVGRTVPWSLLLSVAARPAELLAAALDSVCRARLLEERGEDAYEFAHDVIREVVEGDLGMAGRATLHRRVAAALESASVGAPGDPPVEALAYHYERGGENDRALTYLVKAAERAHRAAAYRQEATFLARAIAIAERLGRPELVAELRAQRGMALYGAGNWTEARGELEAALAGLAVEQKERRAQVLLDLAKVRVRVGDAPGMRRYAAAALTLAEELGRDDLAATALGWLAQTYKSEGHITRSLDLYRRAIARAGGVTNPAFEGAPMVYYWIGQAGEAVKISRQLLDTARQLNDAATTMVALPQLGLALAAQGRYAEAMATFAEARRFGREVELTDMLSRAISYSTGLHLDVFDYAGAEARAAEAYDLARAANVAAPTVVSAGIDLLFVFARRQDGRRFDGLVAQVAELATATAGWHGWLWQIRLAQARAEMALARGAWEEAAHRASDAIERSRASGRVKYQVLGLATRGQALRALGRTNDALPDLRGAVALARPVGDPALLLRAASALLVIEGDDTLLADARAAANQIAGALPDGDMRRHFEAAEAVRMLGQR